MNITIEARNVYGVRRYYVQDQQQASYLYVLTQTKTLNSLQLAALRALGFNITIVEKA